MKRDEWMLKPPPGFLGNNKKESPIETFKSLGADSIEDINKKRSISSSSSLSPSQDVSSFSNPWKRIMMKRALETISLGESTLEQVAIERFGSIEKFMQLKKELNLNDPLPVNRQSNLIDQKGNSSFNHDINQMEIRKLAKQEKCFYKDENEHFHSAFNKRNFHYEYDDDVGREFPDSNSKSLSKQKGKREKRESIQISPFFNQFPSKRDSIEFVEKGGISKRQSPEDHRKFPHFNCQFCLDSHLIREGGKRISNLDLVIAQGYSTYLTIPRFDQIHPFHCLLLPIQHEFCWFDCDDPLAWEELRNFKKSLIQMMIKFNLTPLFVEIVLRNGENVKRHDHSRSQRNKRDQHAFIECLPIINSSSNNSLDIKTFFHKFLTDLDDKHEWTRENKSFIDFTRSNQNQNESETENGMIQRKEPRKFLPRHSNLSYIFIDFKVDYGYLYILSNDQSIRQDEIRRIISNLNGQSNQSFNFESNEKKSVNLSILKKSKEIFSKSYDSFDWTRLLFQSNNENNRN